MISVAEIAERLNRMAGELVPELLPNGHKAGNTWVCSGVHDSGRGSSMWVYLHGAKQGQWRDAGNCPADEEHGDVLDLIRHKRCGGDKGAAVAEAKRILGIEDRFVPAARRPDPAAQAREAEARRIRAEQRQAQDEQERAAKIRGARALFLHDKARAIEGTPAEAYLRGRGIELPAWPRSLRFHPEVWNKEARCKVPALLAMIVNPMGEQIGTHRIFLQADARRGWTKLAVDQPKKVLGTFWGGFIPMAKGTSGKSMRHLAAGERIYCTEGPEDALVVCQKLPAARVICAVSLGNMGAIAFPRPEGGPGTLVLVADRDGAPREVDKLERAIAAQQARGQPVQLVLPPEGFKDVNEWALSLVDRTNVRPAGSMPPVSGRGAA